MGSQRGSPSCAAFGVLRGWCLGGASINSQASKTKNVGCAGGHRENKKQSVSIGCSRIDMRMVICIIAAMRFTWHEPKRQITRQRRGLDFADAELVFAGPIFSFEDDRLDYSETRWVTLGVLRGKVVVVVHTESEDEIHIISMREADKDEQRLFFRNL